jgi:outer membrane receptor protein involved in Fe transport
MSYVASGNLNKAWRLTPIGAAVAGLLYGAAFATPLMAQTAPSSAAAETSLEEIVVTATRRAQSVQEIPFNISAISGAALEKSNIIDSVDALRTMAGVAMYDRGYRNAGVTNGIVIRGMNVDAGTNNDVPLAAPPTVATYIDNTALFGNFVLKDIERIEVLRGPQGTLYGSGSLAGNVRYIMKKPDLSALSAMASVSYGQTDGSDGHNLNPDLLVNIPMGTIAAFRANIGQVKNDGIVDYPNLYVLDSKGDPVVTGGDIVNAVPVYHSAKDVDTVDLKYGRASLLLKPSATFNAQLSYQRQKDEVGGRRQVTRGDSLLTGSPYGKYEFGAIQAEPASRTVELAALEMEVDLAFATLTSSTSHYKHTGTGISDNSGVYARNGWFSFYGSSPRPMAQAERFYDDSAFTQELRLVSNGHQHIDWTGGLYYTKEDYKLGQNSYLVGYLDYMDAINLYGLAPFSTNQDFLFRRNQAYKETAAYGEATINFTDRTHLTLGGRYFKNNVDVNAIVDVPIYSSPANPPGVAAKSIDDNGFLFKANLARDLSQHSMVYATFSQGYRHAGANAVPTSGKYAENPALFTFDSDKNDNIEIGYKGISGKMAFAISGFYTNWKNPQLNTITPNWGFFAAINAKSARTAGLEAELSGKLTDSLSYNLSYTYVDAKLTADVYQQAGNLYGINPTYIDRVAANGNRLPGTAQNVLSLSLQHDMKLSGDFRISTVLSGYYQSGTVNSIGDDNCLAGYSATTSLRCLDSADPSSATYAPTSVYTRSFANIDGFQLWNLSSTLSKDAWAASLFIKNVCNADGTTGKVPYALAGPRVNPTTGAVSATQRYFGNNSRDYIAQPRTIGIAISYKF